MTMERYSLIEFTNKNEIVLPVYFFHLFVRQCFIINHNIFFEMMIEDKQNVMSTPKTYKFNQKERKPLVTALNNYVRSTVSSKQRDEKLERKVPDMKSHPAAKYIIGNTTPLTQEFKRFATLLYQGILYSILSLKGPTDQFLRKKSVRLPQSKNMGLKFLMLDLDETLIHSVFDKERSDIVLTQGEDTLRFNVRPYCLQFLDKLSEHFQIYVFTASTQDYARPIVEFLNMKKKTIQGILSRSNCLQTSHGFKIKDLRVVKNRGLEDIIIVDNLVHSFGLQLDNGIPILEFTNNRDDKELIGLEKLLIELKDVPDVRKVLEKRLALKKCLEVDQDQFMTVKINYRVSRIKKRETINY